MKFDRAIAILKGAIDELRIKHTLSNDTEEALHFLCKSWCDCQKLREMKP